MTSAAGTGLVTIATQTLDSAAAAAADSELTGISGGDAESAAAAGLFNAADLQLSTAATSAFYAGCWPITDSGVLTSLPTYLSVCHDRQPCRAYVGNREFYEFLKIRTIREFLRIIKMSMNVCKIK